jgi:imidazole glycerol-phosphate synthase subunit HisH
VRGMALKVTILDYGIGNILSVRRVFESFGTEVFLTDNPDDVLKAKMLVLPGVGAFADGMQGLRDRNLIGAIRQYSTTDLPFMGICLGMQMMMDESEEFGDHEGLSLIPGKVKAVEHSTIEGIPHKIPHIGWNNLCLPEDKDLTWWKDSILTGLTEKDAAYFVHSFTAVPAEERYRLADTFYGGRLIAAAVRKNNLYGCQFHPEKSGSVGLTIIKNFIELRERTH